MRAALVVSAILHFGLLAAMLISLPSPGSFSTPPVIALPVELITIAEETDLTIGRADETEVVEVPAERTVEAPEPPEPAEQPGATDAPAERVAVDEDAIDSPTQSAAPEPTGPTEPVEVAEPEPEPVEEPPVEVAAVESPEPPQEAPPEPAAAPAPVPERVVPQRKPTPPVRRPRETARVEQPEAETFDADRLSQLINRTANTGGGSGASQASIGAETGRAAAALTLSEQDALRAQINRCWNPPIGLANAEEIVVSIIFSLAPDGTVASIDDMRVPGVGQIFDASADAARRAIIMCQPYTLPPDKYEAWKEVQVNFDPRNLF